MPARIFSSICADIEQLQCLEPLFERQAQCLRRRDMDELAIVNDQIVESTTTLQNHSDQRSGWLQALGFEDSRAGMQRFLDTHSSARTRGQWQTFSLLARQCQAANKLSGQLLAMQQELTDTMLEHLGREQDTSYGEDGSDARFGQSVSLGYA